MKREIDTTKKVIAFPEPEDLQQRYPYRTEPQSGDQASASPEIITGFFTRESIFLPLLDLCESLEEALAEAGYRQPEVFFHVGGDAPKLMGYIHVEVTLPVNDNRDAFLSTLRSRVSILIAKLAEGKPVQNLAVTFQVDAAYAFERDVDNSLPDR